MDWIDVSVPLHEDMAVFTGDPRFHIERTSSMADGAVCNVSRMDLGVHTGTQSTRLSISSTAVKAPK